LLLNLGVRQVLASKITDGVLDVALQRVDYDGAPEAVRRNRDALRRPGVQERLGRLLTLVARSGRHVTMHELLGFLAHLVTGGRKTAEAAQDLPPYYTLAFSDGSPFAEALAPLDPAALVHPPVDMHLWDGQPPGAVEWPGDAPEGDAPAQIADAERARRAFDARKRRFFFEAAEGASLLDLLPSDRADFYELLGRTGRRRDTANVQALEALAAFFGGSAQAGDTALPVWTGLRYDADGPPEAFVANQYLEREDTELRVPRLRSEAARFIEYEPDHLLLRLRPAAQAADRRDAAPPRLRVDLALWLELAKLRRGLPARYRDAAAERKLFRFLSQVAAALPRTRGYARLSVRRAETGHTYQTEVSLDENVYRL